METLKAYPLHGLNAAAAAQLLGIHRNTLRYRVGRMERLLELDLQEAKDGMAILPGVVSRWQEHSYRSTK